MIMTLIYGVIYLVEALIAFQYFEWMFHCSESMVWKRLSLVFFGYIFLFVSFQFHILVLNMITFPICNWIIIRYVYQQSYLNAFFQSVGMTVIMFIAEMIVTALFSGISEKLWDPSKGVLTVFFLAIMSKFLYFLVMFIISYYGTKRKQDVHMGVRGWTVLVTPICVLIVVCLLNYMCFFLILAKCKKVLFYLVC